jgi:hypothetical protein
MVGKEIGGNQKLKVIIKIRRGGKGLSDKFS